MTDKRIVILTPEEIEHAESVGRARSESAIKKNRQLEPNRDASNRFQRDREGAIVEKAIAKHFEITWNPSTDHLDTHIGDVGGYQSKGTGRHNGCLIFRKDRDNPRFPFILGTIDSLPVVMLHGWLWGFECQKDIYWREVGGGVHQAAWFVPQDVLRPMETLEDSRWYE